MPVAGTGERTVFNMHGADSALVPDDVDVSALDCDIFPLGYSLLLDGLDAPDAEYETQAARLLARAHNQTETLTDSTAHAEMLALSAAFAARGNWRLTGARLYVTKEPCPMCAGAIVLSRVDAVVWGVSDPKRGGGTEFGIFGHKGMNHHPEVVSGVLEEPCRSVLVDFFRRRRAEEE